MIVWSSSAEAAFRKRSAILVYGPDCSITDSWETASGPADVLDTSPEQGLLAINNRSEDETSVIELAVAGTHGVKRRWITNATDALASIYGGFLFADLVLP
jgi:hypothetical protein